MPDGTPTCLPLLLLCRRGLSGPHDAGHYNSSSWETGFFVSQGGSWSTPYGHFFLSWYSGLLVRHAERILTAAQQVLNKHGRPRIFRTLKEVGEVRWKEAWHPWAFDCAWTCSCMGGLV